MAPNAIVDIDGTLVDTNYLHTLAWQRALRRHGRDVPAWRIHRHIGMGGDQLVAAVAGDESEREVGDAARSDEGEIYRELVGEASPLPGARELLAALADRAPRVVLASSAKEWEVDAYLDLLDARELADAWTSSADVEQTKPEPDLVRAALDKAGGGPAVLIGDSVWDCEAAARAEIDSIGVLTGGFSECELRDAGAVAVFESAAELCERLGETAFGG